MDENKILKTGDCIADLFDLAKLNKQEAIEVGKNTLLLSLTGNGGHDSMGQKELTALIHNKINDFVRLL